MTTKATFLSLILTCAFNSWSQQGNEVHITRIDTNYFAYNDPWCGEGNNHLVLDGYCFWELKNNIPQGLYHIYNGNYKNQRLVDTTAIEILYVEQAHRHTRCQQLIDYQTKKIQTLQWSNDSIYMDININYFNDYLSQRIKVTDSRQHIVYNTVQNEAVEVPEIQSLISEKRIAELKSILPEWEIVALPYSIHLMHSDSINYGRTMRRSKDQKHLFLYERVSSFDIFFAPIIDTQLIAELDTLQLQFQEQWNAALDTCDGRYHTKNEAGACRKTLESMMMKKLPTHYIIGHTVMAFVSEISITNLIREKEYYIGSTRETFDPESRTKVIEIIKSWALD